jgi:type IV fimbrial biogenesis protein FimT
MQIGTGRRAGKTPLEVLGHRGFTLVEMMVTVAIAAVLAGFALPNLSSFLQKVKLNAISGSLVASLQLARSEAIKMNRPVIVCRRNTTSSGCSNTSTDWGGRGWWVCYAQFTADVCDTSTAALPNPIRVEAPIDTTFAALAIGTASVVRFSPTGAQGTGTVTFTITGNWAGATPLTVTIAPSGLIKGTRA